MKRLVATALITIAMCGTTMYGQSRRDMARYDVMNGRGVWSVGVSMMPLVSIVHPAGEALGGGVSSLGVAGMGIEGSYFVADNLRVAAEIAFANNSFQTSYAAFAGEAYTDLSATTFALVGYYHMGRWYAGVGLCAGRTSLRYHATTLPEGVNIERFGDEDITQRKGSFGLQLSGGYMVSPFLKVGGYWRPSLAGGGYAHTLGASLTIYLPFVDAVVCK